MVVLSSTASSSAVDSNRAVSSEELKAAELDVKRCSTHAAEDRLGTAASPALTRREGQTYALVIAGKANKEIAASLGISSRTVKFHVANILKKRCVTSRLELFAKVVDRAGLGIPDLDRQPWGQETSVAATGMKFNSF